MQRKHYFNRIMDNNISNPLLLKIHYQPLNALRHDEKKWYTCGEIVEFSCVETKLWLYGTSQEVIIDLWLHQNDFNTTYWNIWCGCPTGHFFFWSHQCWCCNNEKKWFLILEHHVVIIIVKSQIHFTWHQQKTKS